MNSDRFYARGQDFFQEMLNGAEAGFFGHPLTRILLSDRAPDAFERFYVLASDIEEGDEAYTLKVEVPGLTTDDVSIDFVDGRLSIVGDYKEGTGLRKGKWKTAYNIKDVDGGAIGAKLESGILIITLPKKAESKPVKIKIG